MSFFQASKAHIRFPDVPTGHTHRQRYRYQRLITHFTRDTHRHEMTRITLVNSGMALRALAILGLALAPAALSASSCGCNGKLLVTGGYGGACSWPSPPAPVPMCHRV